MTKHRPRASKVSGSRQQLEQLLAAMGFGESDDPLDHIDLYTLTQSLEEIERGYRLAASRKQPNRKLVGRYRATLTKLLALSKNIGSDFFANDIHKASLSRQNPGIDDRSL